MQKGITLDFNLPINRENLIKNYTLAKDPFISNVT
jgi:hypothetical protein